MEINIVYVAMDFHNFIKFYSENEKDIYYILTNILNNVDSNDRVSIIQFSLA